MTLSLTIDRQYSAYNERCAECFQLAIRMNVAMLSFVMLDVVAPICTDLEDDGNDVCVRLEGDAKLPSKL